MSLSDFNYNIQIENKGIVSNFTSNYSMVVTTTSWSNSNILVESSFSAVSSISFSNNMRILSINSVPTYNNNYYSQDKIVFSGALYNDSNATCYFTLYWFRANSVTGGLFFNYRVSSGINGTGTVYAEDYALGQMIYYPYITISGGYVMNTSGDIVGVGIYAQRSDVQGFSPDYISGSNNHWIFFKIPYISGQHGGKLDFSLQSEAYGDASTTGGYTGGSFDDSSDTIAIPTMPTMGVTSAGFINVYNPTQGQLANLGAELFPDLQFTPSTPVSGSSDIVDAIQNVGNALIDITTQIPQIVDMYVNANLIQYVIDCHLIPIKPTTGASSAVKIGFKTFTPSPNLVTSDYVDFDCGTINIAEYYANFIDYAYTRAKLFLPFVGFVDLANEYWQGGNLNVTYRFNIIDGSFMAFVKSTSSKSNLSNTVIAQYGGNACIHIPITGLAYSNLTSGIVGGATQAIAPAVGAVGETVGNAIQTEKAKPNIQQSNSYNATTSFLGVRVPYLVIERSVSNFSVNYTDEQGIPSNISTSFANLVGFTQASNVHLDGISGATETELDEIATLLAQGVIF